MMGVDVVVWVKDDMQWDDIDISILEKLKSEGAPSRISH